LSPCPNGMGNGCGFDELGPRADDRQNFHFSPGSKTSPLTPPSCTLNPAP
jgi:hypothetical protein